MKLSDLSLTVVTIPTEVCCRVELLQGSIGLVNLATNPRCLGLLILMRLAVEAILPDPRN